jgi:N-methylhydantoinase B
MGGDESAGLARIRDQILWNRLIAVVEEQAQALVRTAFSTSVRESGDLSAGVFDRRGRMVAQAVTGTPGHVNSMANAIVHFLAKYPIDEMRPGDHYITNDPWLTSGHLHDVTVVSPTFHKGRAVALFACTIHVVDIGGRGFGPDGRQVFEEGLAIPILPLARAGELNEMLLEMVRENVREPAQVVGDIIACATANDEGSRVLVGLMKEYRLADLEALSDYIIDTSRARMLERIRALPFGTYRHSVRVDGYERPVDLVAALTIAEDGIHIDYAGTSPASQYGINVVLNYTQAYTTFGVNCILGGDIPNNHGSLSVVKVTAPAGCIVNAQRPAPVAMRHGIGHTMPDVVFGCLDQAIPGRVPAQGSAALWNPQFSGGSFAVDAAQAGAATDNLREFTVLSFHAGGMGARPDKDGLSATAFPSGVRTMPIEVTESISPLVFWRKELRQDSGGAGRSRGGLGHRLVLGTVDEAPFSIQLTADRIMNPPKGLNGGEAGGAADARLASGKKLRPKGFQTIPAGDRIVLEIAGGGGYGDPSERAPERIAADVRHGYVSAAAAERQYGAVIGADGEVDVAATRRTRGSG